MSTSQTQPSEIVWVPEATTWIPVWVTLHTGSQQLDALERAVLRYVALGAQDAAQIARELGMPAELVDSAVASLCSRGRIKPDDSPLGQVVLQLDEEDEPRWGRRRGWVVWEPRQARPLADIVLAAQPPDFSDAESELTPIDGRVDHPKWHDIDQQIARLVAMDLRVMETFAHGHECNPDAQVRELALRRDHRLLRGYAWTPVEFVGISETVRRPCALPVDAYGAELASAGWGPFVGRLQAHQREALETRRRAHLTEVAPGVLRKLGYQSVDELVRWSQHRYDVVMGAEGRQLWPEVREEMLHALQAQEMARAIDTSSESVSRIWAHVLELLTRQLASRAVELAKTARQRPPGEDAADTRAAQAVLGRATWAHVRGLHIAKNRNRLQAATQDQRLTIGARLTAMGWAVWTDSAYRSWAERLRVRGEAQPAFFELLSRAVEQRNDLIHPKSDGPPVNLLAFRMAVLALCRGAASARG